MSRSRQLLPGSERGASVAREEFRREVALRLKEARRERTLTQRQLADLGQSTQQNISRYEKGFIPDSWFLLSRLHAEKAIDLNWLLAARSGAPAEAAASKGAAWEQSGAPKESGLVGAQGASPRTISGTLPGSSDAGRPGRAQPQPAKPALAGAVTGTPAARGSEATFTTPASEEEA